MNKKIVRAAFAAILLGTTASVALVASPAAAASDKDKKPPEKTISRALTKPMFEAQKAVQAGDWTTAMAKLKEAQAVPERTPFDDYKINQFMAYAAVNLKDYPTAITAYEAMAASPEEEPADKAGTRHNLVLLNYDAKDYAKTLKYGEQLIALGAPVDMKLAVTMGQAYYFTNNYPLAEQWSKKAIDAAVAANLPPDQGALSVLLSSQAKQGKQTDAAATLEMIAANYGKASDWGQLIDVALGTPGIQNSDGIDLYRLRDATGSMQDADDYALMSTIALQLGYPGEAKTILDQGIQAGRLTTTGKAASQYKSATAGAATDDKTLPKFAKDAETRKTGDYDEKLAETYFGYKRYAEAETAARRALSKPGLKDALQTKMVLAMSLARQDKYQDAQAVFKEVEAAGGRAARVKAAHLWASYCQSKMPKPVAAAAPAAAPAPAAQPAQPQQ